MVPWRTPSAGPCGLNHLWEQRVGGSAGPCHGATQVREVAGPHLGFLESAPPTVRATQLDPEDLGV